MQEPTNPIRATQPTIDVRWPFLRVAHVVLGGEHDLSNVERLDRILTETLGWCSQMVVDLRHVRFVDSSTVRALLTARDRAEASHRRFDVVLTPRSLVERSLELTKALETLSRVDTLEEALTARAFDSQAPRPLVQPA